MSVVNILKGAELKSLISGTHSDIQFQPAGVDLTMAEVHKYVGDGTVDFDNSKRVLSTTEKLHFDKDGIVHLQRGCYKIVYNETVKIPEDCIALGFPRSSLLRCAATVECAVWDPGYVGRSESMLIVSNPQGLNLHKNARVLQLVFFRIGSAVEKGYSGIYKGENIGKK